MKKVIITLILVSWMIILFAQSNLQIVDPAKKWTVIYPIRPWSPNFYKQSYYVKWMVIRLSIKKII